MKKTLVTIHDLDSILISSRIHASYTSQLTSILKDLFKKYPELTPEDIPDERFAEYSDGSAEIFCIIKNTRIAMGVPKSEWNMK